MTTPVKQKQTDLEDLNLTPAQRELARALERSFQQVERGETRPLEEFLRELRSELEAEDCP